MSENKKYSKKNFEARIESETGAVSRITNNDLTCRDCIYKFDDSLFVRNTCICEQYAEKPLKVVNGGMCDLKVSEA